MAIYFVDSSALVKRYISETGSTWVLELFNPAIDNAIFVAAITGVEIIAAIARRSRTGSISTSDATVVCNQFRDDLQTDYQIVEITEEIITSGMALAETLELRGYDAVQLAAGCTLNKLCIASGLPVVTFVSADHQLNLAAVAKGLSVENPNSYS
jgi:uncharacterized protein